MATARVAIIGAGMAGLCAAMDLARGGFEVTVFESAATPGGKLRQVTVAGRSMDAGPTVFTLRGIFDELFADAGETFTDHVHLTPAAVLARHAWNDGQQFDLFADRQHSLEALRAFAGPGEAQAFVRFAAQAQRIYRTLEHSFIRASRPSPVGLARRLGLAGLADLWNIQPFQTLWRSAGRYFADPRLQQLFGRYATYCGASPFLAPATLALVAHVEQAGVWYVQGGMHELARQVARAAQRQGASLRYGTQVSRIRVSGGRVQALELANDERISVDAVIFAGDTNALASGFLGGEAVQSTPPTPQTARSLSAMTWNLVAKTAGFELAHHTVFFCRDYRREFADIFGSRRVPAEPTIYLCAQDRIDADAPPQRGGDDALERLFCLINAPAIGDTHEFTPSEIGACESLVFRQLEQFGLRVERHAAATLATTPTHFHQLFPATGGALYGRASHGWRASFIRPGSRSAIPNLFLAGGSTHPGPGVPMAATSGRLAAAALIQDYASIGRSPATATAGGTSMR